MSAGFGWDAGRYLQFDDLRNRPARELRDRVPLSEPAQIVDLGCGPGNSTALLAERWPQAQLTGVDNSPAMLTQARGDYPDWHWIEADIALYEPPAGTDLLFSNAAFQWLPDHQELLPRLLRCLAPGGVLAAQMPMSHDLPALQAIRATADDGPWAGQLAGVRRSDPVATPQAYYDWLAPLASALDIWTVEYQQIMAGPAAILDWVRGTSLRPFLAALPSDQQADFEAGCLRRITEAYPTRVDGRVIFPFRRLFLVARV